MSKLILEMEIPKYMCGDCEISIDGFACKKARTNGGKCPIVGVLPDEHGDLIDKDALKKDGMMYRGGIDEDGLIYVPLRDVMKSISNAPAVITAERKDDEQIH